jgi:hypothetical protein
MVSVNVNLRSSTNCSSANLPTAAGAGFAGGDVLPEKSAEEVEVRT